MTKSTDKREQSLEVKYGGKAELAAKRREWQAKSRKKYKGTGGFRWLKENNPERFKEITSKGGSSRGKATGQKTNPNK